MPLSLLYLFSTVGDFGEASRYRLQHADLVLSYYSFINFLLWIITIAVRVAFISCLPPTGLAFVLFPIFGTDIFGTRPLGAENP